MNKPFTFYSIGRQYNEATKRYRNEYMIIKGGENFIYQGIQVVGVYVVGYKQAFKEYSKLKKKAV